MPQKVRIGVISTSGWVERMHLPSLKSHPQAEVVAICGRKHERAEEVAKKYEIPLIFSDYREMIEKGELDALVVGAPDDLHYPMTMMALDAGLHVLCEKPLGMNVGQAKEMYQKAEASGLKHMTYFTWRWLPHYRYLRRLIDEGYLGRPYQCHFRFLNSEGNNPKFSWKYERKRCNGTWGV